MNIFVLDYNLIIAARMACDKHVVKMPLETAQILSTVNGGPYKPTHQNHPCTLWSAAFSDNYDWLVCHGLALCAEYTYRYGKVHSSEAVIWELSSCPEFVAVGSSKHPRCMPEQYKVDDVVESYRNFYHGDKSRFAVWNRGRPQPFWWNPNNE